MYSVVLKILKVVVLVLFAVATRVGFSQKDESPVFCDSTGFAISSSRAFEIALDKEYGRFVRNRVESVLEGNSCVWKVTLRQMMGERHHGYYSATFHVYYIHPETGEIIRETGWKELEGKIPER